MDIVTETYQRLTECLQSSLAGHGFEIAEEHHHTQSAGSRYVVLMNSNQAVCLTWDAEEELFRLECCLRTEAADGGVWEMVCQERFHPLIDGPERTQSIVETITANLTDKLPID
jgi:hypothetical protein